jgi:hypothetical protein
VSKATDRTWRKTQDKHHRERQALETAAHERRLIGFKTATLGDMLTAINKRGQQ